MITFEIDGRRGVGKVKRNKRHTLEVMLLEDLEEIEPYGKEAV